MLNIMLAVVAIVVVAAIAVAYLVLVVSDICRTKGEPLHPNAQRSLNAQRDAERRVNKGAHGGVW